MLREVKVANLKELLQAEECTVNGSSRLEVWKGGKYLGCIDITNATQVTMNSLVEAVQTRITTNKLVAI